MTGADGSADLVSASASELRALLASKEISARELLELHLARIAETNPVVNAVVSLDIEAAIRTADRADSALARGEVTGYLHGLPAVVKDTHDTAGMPTTYGSPLLRDNVPAADELIVARMRAAGAVVLGKSNVPEYAAGSHTFNSVFGLTRNPYDVGRSAGGSSGGAAAALATGMAAVADGSDLGGSLRNPASFCNVVGLRPSPGRVPRRKDDAFWDLMTVDGPIGRTVDDVGLLLAAIAGPDRLVPGALDDDPARFARITPIEGRGLRVAWSDDLGGSVPVDPHVRAVVAAAAELVAGLGARVEAGCLDFTGADMVFRTIRAWSFYRFGAELLAHHSDDLKPSLRWNIEAGSRVSGADLAEADRMRRDLFIRTQLFFDSHDILLLPTSQVPPFDARLEFPPIIEGVRQPDYLSWMRSCYYVTVLGCPALSVPAGFTPDGLPVGVQIVGRPGADLAVLQAGRLFTEAAGPLIARRPALSGRAGPGPDIKSAGEDGRSE